MYSTYFTILTDPSGLTCKLIILSKFSKIDQSKQMLLQIPIFMGLKHTSPPQILLILNRGQILDLMRQRGKKLRNVIIVIIMIQKSGHYIVPVMVKNLVKYVFFRIYLFLFN